MLWNQVRLRDGFETDWAFSLEQFCEQLAEKLNLPAFEYDDENVYEWGFVQIEYGFIEVNISRPHNGRNPPFDALAVLLLVSEKAPVEWNADWLAENLMPQYAQAILEISGNVRKFVR